MKDIYLQIWDLARPYYEKGRPMDIDHIEWMMTAADQVVLKEAVDETLLLPLVILHDVGYAEVDHSNPFNTDTRIEHMQKGSAIAKNILNSLNYPKDKIDMISYYVSVHDNWALGDREIYRAEPLLAIFNDLDFMWMATPKGYEPVKKMLKKSDREMIEYLDKNEKVVNRPWACSSTKEMFGEYISELKERFINS